MVAHGTMLNGRLFVLYTVSALRLYLSIFSSYFAAVVAGLWPAFSTPNKLYLRLSIQSILEDCHPLAIASMMSIQMKSIILCEWIKLLKERAEDIIPYYESFSLFTIVRTTTKISRKLSIQDPGLLRQNWYMILKECCREHGSTKTLALSVGLGFILIV
ncbi:hypothetical protein NE237_012372 [Protea cynaroides]|uniref:Uncharacterized protein n=1 Tax=Protea cynaroides TaxID=273540 RepID=A0A9Q0GXT7_9MAGN|nr:hypothetical protein NE237_012372 [Protea cynaroides]